MKFELKGTANILTVFDTVDPYDLFQRLVKTGPLDGEPQTVRLSVGGRAGVILLNGRPTKQSEDLLRRLWAKPANERAWALAERVSYHAERQRLDVVFA